MILEWHLLVLVRITVYKFILAFKPGILTKQMIGYKIRYQNFPIMEYLLESRSLILYEKLHTTFHGHIK